MSSVYALLVGIQRYLDPEVPPLYGCHADIADAAEFLAARCGHATKLAVRELRDDQATGAALVHEFRTHLSGAGPGDLALFWFSGHGSLAPVPADLWHVEPNGVYLQTLVCADSRHEDRPDLLDKELALLLGEVADGGAHVVAVLDSCHAGGATRGPEVRARAVRPRLLPSDTSLLPGLHERYAAGPPAERYVSLAACQPLQLAGEQDLAGRPRGLFSWALLRAMRSSGPGTTYRELVVLARNEVERLSAGQTPQVFPAGPGIADRRLFGGGVITPPPALVMRYGRDGWQINAGSCHGFRPGVPGDPGRVAVVGSPPLREARVLRVEVRRGLVEPIGWEPDRRRLYPVVVSRVPVPATTVVIDDDVAPGVAAGIRSAIGVAGPAGTPSPHVRLSGAAEAELAVWSPDRNTVRVADRDRIALHDAPADAGGLPTVAALEHIARWRQIRHLANPVSRLRDAVTVEMVEPGPDEMVAPRHRDPVRPGADGAVRLTYAPEGGGWVAPTVFLRLRNNSRQPLYCVLLDLTDGFRVSADLFRGAEISAGSVAAVAEGRRIEFTLPAGRPVRPGALVRDWLMLVVSEDEFAAGPFELPALDAHPVGVRGGAGGVPGLAERLGLSARYRDLGPVAASTAGDWWTTVLPVVTEVPDGRTGRSSW